MELVAPVVSEEYLYFCPIPAVSPHPLHLLLLFSNSKIHYCLYVMLFLTNLLAGTDKSDSADKVAEKLEELSVKEESRESEKKETKEKTEEKQ